MQMRRFKQIGPFICLCPRNESFKFGNCFPGAREDNSHYIFQAVAAHRSMRKFRFLDRVWFSSIIALCCWRSHTEKFLNLIN